MLEGVVSWEWGVGSGEGKMGERRCTGGQKSSWRSTIRRADLGAI